MQRSLRQREHLFLEDFDRDEYIGRDDLERSVRCLTREELTNEEVEFIADRVKTILQEFVYSIF